MVNQYAKFLATFVRHPVAIGAIAPSSRHLAELMIEDMDLARANTVVEIGPGTGVFTKVIQENIPPEAALIAVEINPQFASDLKQKLPRAHIINGSAEHLREYLTQHGRSNADAVLCGLPWASFPRDLQNRLVSAIYDSLKPGGRFATFAYCHGAWLPQARRFQNMIRTKFAKMETTRIIWRNLPPAWVYRCEK
jgi:phospholipid N-methyltransferase